MTGRNGGDGGETPEMIGIVNTYICKKKWTRQRRKLEDEKEEGNHNNANEVEWNGTQQEGREVGFFDGQGTGGNWHLTLALCFEATSCPINKQQPSTDQRAATTCFVVGGNVCVRTETEMDEWQNCARMELCRNRLQSR